MRLGENLGVDFVSWDSGILVSALRNRGRILRVWILDSSFCGIVESRADFVSLDSSFCVAESLADFASLDSGFCGIVESRVDFVIWDSRISNRRISHAKRESTPHLVILMALARSIHLKAFATFCFCQK